MQIYIRNEKKGKSNRKRERKLRIEGGKCNETHT
jgi:hypothetical protein